MRRQLFAEVHPRGHHRFAQFVSQEVEAVAGFAIAQGDANELLAVALRNSGEVYALGPAQRSAVVGQLRWIDQVQPLEDLHIVGDLAKQIDDDGGGFPAEPIKPLVKSIQSKELPKRRIRGKLVGQQFGRGNRAEDEVLEERKLRIEERNDERFDVRRTVTLGQPVEEHPAR